MNILIKCRTFGFTNFQQQIMIKTSNTSGEKKKKKISNSVQIM